MSAADRFAAMKAKAERKAGLGKSGFKARGSEDHLTPRREEILNVIPITIVSTEDLAYHVSDLQH